MTLDELRDEIQDKIISFGMLETIKKEQVDSLCEIIIVEFSNYEIKNRNTFFKWGFFVVA